MTTQDKPVKAQWEELAEWGTELEIEGAEDLVAGEPAASAVPPGKLPQVVLPSNGVTISVCAQDLFQLIAPSKRLFARGGG